MKRMTEEMMKDPDAHKDEILNEVNDRWDFISRNFVRQVITMLPPDPLSMTVCLRLAGTIVGKMWMAMGRPDSALPFIMEGFVSSLNSAVEGVKIDVRTVTPEDRSVSDEIDRLIRHVPEGRA